MKKKLLVIIISIMFACSVYGQKPETVKEYRAKYQISKTVADTTTVHKGSKGGIYIYRRSAKTQKLYKYYLNLK